MPHPTGMTYSKWVALLYFIAWQSHQSCLIPKQGVSDSTLFLCQAASSHDQWQQVSDTGQFLCQAVSSIMYHPMTTRLWVTLLYFFAFARQSHQSCLTPMTNRMWVIMLYFFAWPSHLKSCLIPSPTDCEWHCFISFPCSLINYVSSHDQQYVSDSDAALINHVLSHHQQGVSDTALFLHQAASSIISHPMTNRLWVTLLSFSPWHVSSHNQQYVSDTAIFLCFAVSSIISYPMTNREWVTLLYFFPRQSHSSSHDQQGVSNIALFFARQSHRSCLKTWPTASE